MCTTFVFAMSKVIYGLLFTGEYVQGYIIAPYLFLAPLLQMLFQVACNQFLVVKRTWPNLFILSVGAFLNIVLNLWLIPVIGIEGAAVATLVGYMVSDIICVVVLTRMKLMCMERRFVISVIIMVIFIIVWRFILIESFILSLGLAIISCILMISSYMKDIGIFLKNFRKQ